MYLHVAFWLFCTCFCWIPREIQHIRARLVIFVKILEDASLEVLECGVRVDFFLHSEIFVLAFKGLTVFILFQLYV